MVYELPCLISPSNHGHLVFFFEGNHGHLVDTWQIARPCFYYWMNSSRPRSKLPPAPSLPPTAELRVCGCDTTSPRASLPGGRHVGPTSAEEEPLRVLAVVHGRGGHGRHRRLRPCRHRDRLLTAFSFSLQVVGTKSTQPLLVAVSAFQFLLWHLICSSWLFD